MSLKVEQGSNALPSEAARKKQVWLSGSDTGFWELGWRGNEVGLQNGLCSIFKASGYSVSKEERINVGRTDIIVDLGREFVPAIIEVKVNDPLRGVGQLLSYARRTEQGHYYEMLLVSEWSKVDFALWKACIGAGVELWAADGRRLISCTSGFMSDHIFPTLYPPKMIEEEAA